MALTELQLPTKQNFYSQLQYAASEMDQVLTKWANIAEFVERIDTADLDAMGVPAGQLRTDLNEFKTVINEFMSFYQGSSVTPTNAPDGVIDKIRRMV